MAGTTRAAEPARRSPEERAAPAASQPPDATAATLLGFPNEYRGRAAAAKRLEIVQRSIPTWTLWLAGAGIVLAGLLAYAIAGSSGGTPDPLGATHRLGDGAVALNSGILVLREGLECVLVLAAVTASLLGARRALRRPVALGGLAGFGAAVATWFVAVAVLDSIAGVDDGTALDVQAATGLLAILVLLVVMNWFFHSVYWTGWISLHHRRRRGLLAGADSGDITHRRLIWGLALLGFTCVYREGFEIVLFLQTLRLGYGSGIVLAGAGIGLAATVAIGTLTFAFQHKLPYKKMLVATGVLLGVVLIVMVGENVQEMQAAGWLPTTPAGIAVPGWVGLWFAVFPNVEGLVAQGLAALLVIGSYLVAEEIRVKRPRRRGREAARRADQPPAERPALGQTGVATPPAG